MVIVLPAIDLYDGKAVRLRQGNYEDQQQYGDPLDAALRYEEAGATHVHLVDLAAARSGRSDDRTLEMIRRILAQTRLKVEVGGGIRTREDLLRFYDAGVWRCVLGTAAVRNLDFTRQMIAEFGEQIIVGIDVKNGQVAISGWTETEAISAHELGITLQSFGLRECIYTDISKDGMLSGINLTGALDLARQTGLKIIVSGGVKDLQDIELIAKQEGQGLSGVVIGKALYEGRLSLVDVFARVRG